MMSVAMIVSGIFLARLVKFETLEQINCCIRTSKSNSQNVDLLKGKNCIRERETALDGIKIMPIGMLATVKLQGRIVLTCK